MRETHFRVWIQLRDTEFQSEDSKVSELSTWCCFVCFFVPKPFPTESGELIDSFCALTLTWGSYTNLHEIREVISLRELWTNYPSDLIKQWLKKAETLIFQQSMKKIPISIMEVGEIIFWKWYVWAYKIQKGRGTSKSVTSADSLALQKLSNAASLNSTQKARPYRPLSGCAAAVSGWGCRSEKAIYTHRGSLKFTWFSWMLLETDCPWAWVYLKVGPA